MSKLLKEAIADAKAVRETALANARLALEEAFAPRLQSMLTKKLKEEEMDLEDDVVAPEDDEVEVAEEESEEVHGEEDETVEYDEESMEEGSYSEEDSEEEEAEEVADEEAEEVADEEEAEEVADEEADEEEVEEDDLYEEDEEEDSLDLESIIKELEADLEINEDEEEAVEEQSDSSEIGKADNHVDVADHSDGEDPQGTSLTEEEEDQTEEDESTEDLEEEIDIEIVDEEKYDEEDETDESDEESMEEGSYSEEDEEEIDLEEILKELEEESTDVVEEDETSAEIEELRSTNEKLQKENDEYRKVYKLLRGKLNEVNLLNAKLLYTNKLFKEFALEEDQKLKVVESFDLTKNVREAKLVYATLGESFRTTVESRIVETEKKVEKSAPAPTAKKSLTEGLASKAIKSTKPSKQILSEGNDLADRFKKLAGIVE